MQKHTFAAALSALLATVACNRQEPTLPTGDGGAAEVTVHIQSPLTRSRVADTADEARVSTVDIFVFRGDVLDAHETGLSSTTVTVQATQGERTVFAVVNAGEDLGAVSTLSGLRERISRLDANSRNNFVMTGSKTQTLGATATVNLDVERLAARFKIDKITNRLASSTQAADFKITRIYLTNVAGNIRYDAGKASTTLWYADSKLNVSGAPNNLIYNKLSTPAAVSAQGSHTTSYSFYAYPNTDSSKNTLLVVEALISGKYYTYPLMIAGTVDRNKSYEVKELIITRVGNPSDGDDDIEGDENTPIQSSQATVTLNVLDWDQVLIGENGTITI